VVATGVAAKTATGAYDEALAGGRHTGFLRNYANKPTPQIERGITSIEREIAEHQPHPEPFRLHRRLGIA
jgi:hypothetical protein